MKTPLVNLDIPAPEWSVVGVPCEGSDSHMDRVHVYQNGALVADAVSDEPTYDALCELAVKANAHAALVAALKRAKVVLLGTAKNPEYAHKYNADHLYSDVADEVEAALKSATP